LRQYAADLTAASRGRSSIKVGYDLKQAGGESIRSPEANPGAFISIEAGGDDGREGVPAWRKPELSGEIAPANDAARRDRMAGDFGALAGLRVLIADDEVSIRSLYRAVISKIVTDAVVITAKDGAEAVACAQAHQPDVIVMDLAMPVLDGLAATRALKAAAATAMIPVIAFTGQEWDMQGVMDAGCAAFLTKPCNPRQLLATVAQVLERAGGVRDRR
jgi:CheY-like chemotaxis protein